ncbi:MAG TPA: LysM peptidoglycan-binding domain-containing protein [Dehalococcoidia bacterium]|nr:LysM peptidoglycan-binding domain-containing protein [Dehalococcoidia bacterium]
MGAKLIGGLVGLVIVIVLAQTFVFGGGGDLPNSPGGRAGLVPTATPPAQLPDPILLGSSSGATGPSGGATAGTTYTVQPGDTLGVIANNFKVPAAQQAQWLSDVLRLNGLADAHLLQVGQVLNLPGVAPVAGTTPTGGTPTGSSGTSGAAQPTSTLPAGAPTPKATATVASSGSGDTYTVVSGDTPYDIAAKFCVSTPAPWVNELLTLNNIDPSNIRIGQVLQLPQGTPAQCKQ